MRLFSAAAALATCAAVSAASALPQEPLQDILAGSPLSNLTPNDPQSANLTDYVVSGKYSLLQLHRSLVEIPSVSADEHAVANFLAQYLRDAGLTVELQQVATDPVNYNVYAYLGSARNAPVVLTSHIDTVPPFTRYFVQNTAIHGRGSCDAKALVATQTIAFLEMVAQGKLQEGQVALLFVVGEETLGTGMRRASHDLGVQWDVAIFGEPTENKLGVGHKGIVLFDVEVHGRASHSGYPELGISATEILVPILAQLQTMSLPTSGLLGQSTLNVGRIEAGVAANVVPAYGKATVAVRVAGDFNETIAKLRSVVDGVDHVSPFSYYGTEPQYLDFDVPGFDSIVLKYTTDVPNLQQPLKKRFLYGPGTIHVAHSANEYVENADLLQAVGGYQRLVSHALSI